MRLIRLFTSFLDNHCKINYSPKFFDVSGQNDRVLSEKEYEMIDKRRERHLNGESSSFSWDEVKQQARQAVEE